MLSCLRAVGPRRRSRSRSPPIWSALSRRRWNGRDCLALELTDDEQSGRLNKTRSGNGPSFAIVHRDFTDGVIEADIGAELTGKGAPDDRGFAGLSFHIGPDFETHETVYLRMTNGRLNVPPPPPPRIDRAIQYVAHPDFHFDVSREAFPGRYEKGADIAIGRWHRLRLEVQGTHLRALVRWRRSVDRGRPALPRPARARRAVRR